MCIHTYMYIYICIYICVEMFIVSPPSPARGRGAPAGPGGETYMG